MNYTQEPITSFIVIEGGNGMTTDKMIPSLMFFRFITALVVYLFHCKIHFGWEPGIAFFDRLLNNSAVFVTEFFALSTYIMANSLLKL